MAIIYDEYGDPVHVDPRDIVRGSHREIGPYDEGFDCTYEIHPAANIFPRMTDAEFRELKEDIENNGQRVPVIMYQDKVLDGRHRAAACAQLRVPLHMTELNESPHFDPVKYVISTNLIRRHLNESQRAMVAAKIANIRHGSNRFLKKLESPTETNEELPNRHDPPIGGSINTENSGFYPISSREAAQLVNVSTRSVERARAVTDKGSDAVIEAVERGQIPISVAQKLVEAVVDKEAQSGLVHAGKDAVIEYITPKDDIERNRGMTPAERFAEEWRFMRHRKEALMALVECLNEDEVELVLERLNKWFQD